MTYEASSDRTKIQYYLFRAMAYTGGVIILVLLVVTATPGHASCPAVCKCPGSYRADCCNASLKSIPANLDSETRFLNASNNLLSALMRSDFNSINVLHLKILELSDNKISVIENGALSFLEELIFLYLSRNEIINIGQDVFKSNKRLEFLKLDGNVLELPVNKPFLNIPSLKTFDMASCNLRDIPEISFVRLYNLEELRLSHNRLRNLKSGVFLSLKSLKYLYLSDNLLQELSDDLFISLKELEILDLSNNQLHTLGQQVFSYLDNVQHLDLSKNKLKTVEVGVFSPLGKLKHLHLHNNILNSLSEKHFFHLSSLALLDLSGNRLEDLHFRIMCQLNNLTYLKVSNNRLACDCGLWQVWNWSIENGVRILSTCEQPEIFEEFRKNNTCNSTTCNIELQNDFRDEFVTPVYLYVIVSLGFLLVFIALCLTVWAIVRYRHEMCKTRKVQVSAIEYSRNTMTYLSGQQVQQFTQLQHGSLRQQIDLQQELHRRHQETIMRNRLHREQSSSLKSLPKPKSQEIRHSYHEARYPSVGDEDKSWFNADTLPASNRNSVFIPSASSHNDEQGACAESVVGESALPFRGSRVLEGNASTPKFSTSVLCPLPRRSLLLDASSSESDAVVPEENFLSKRL